MSYKICCWICDISSFYAYIIPESYLPSFICAYHLDFCAVDLDSMHFVYLSPFWQLSWYILCEVYLSLNWHVWSLYRWWGSPWLSWPNSPRTAATSGGCSWREPAGTPSNRCWPSPVPRSCTWTSPSSGSSPPPTAKTRTRGSTSAPSTKPWLEQVMRVKGQKVN